MIRIAIEVVVLAIAVISPWAFGAVDPVARYWIAIGLAVLLLLWAARLVASRSWHNYPRLPFFFLTGFVLLSAIQLCPIPRWVANNLSPGSADVYAYYVPPQPELLPNETAVAPPHQTLTVCEFDTRDFLAGALAICILFAVVTHNLSTPGALTRLAWACVINGTLLSLLAFAQYIGSPKDTIYFSVKTPGAVFGPFICRDHFSFYVNICIGLGLGLLAATGKQKGLLQNSRAIWLLSCLALMMTAVSFSLSRGGLLALIAAISLGVLLWSTRRSSGSPAVFVMALLPLVVLIGTFIGWATVENRFSIIPEDAKGRLSLWSDSLGFFPSFPLFGAGNGTFLTAEPVERTAKGMEHIVYDHAHNEYVEALVEGGIVRLGLTIALIVSVTVAGVRAYRSLCGRTQGWLILGGLIGFWAVALHSVVDFGIHLPSVAVLATVVTAHVVGARRDSKSAQGALTKAAISETKKSVQVVGVRQESKSNPGAIAKPAIIERPKTASDLEGMSKEQLYALADRLGKSPENILAVGLIVVKLESMGEDLSKRRTSRLKVYRMVGRGVILPELAARFIKHPRRLEEISKLPIVEQRKLADSGRAIALPLPVCIALAAPMVLVAGLLAWEGYRQDRAARFRNAAKLERTTDTAKAITYLKAAVHYEPDSPILRFELGHAYLDRSRETATAAEADSFVREALREWRQARDQSPLFAAVQAGLGVHRDLFAQAPDTIWYFERALRAAPTDPNIWYACGKDRFDHGDWEKAWFYWRQTLTFSDAYMAPILKDASTHFKNEFDEDKAPDKIDKTSTKVVNAVMPDERPDIIWKCADHLYPHSDPCSPKFADERQPFLTKALKILDNRGADNRTAADDLLRGRILLEQGHGKESVAAYEEALKKDRDLTGIRVELARALYEMDRFEDAKNQLDGVVLRQPANVEARDLLDEVEREIEMRK